MISAIVLLILVGSVWRSLAARPDVAPLLTLSLAAYIFFWAILPLGYGALRPQHTGYPLADPDYVRIMRLHLLSLGGALAFFRLLPARQWKALSRSGAWELSDPALYRGLVLAALMFVFGEIWSLSITGWGFVANVQFAVRGSEADLSHKGLLEAVLNFLVGFAIVCAVRDWGDRPYAKRITIVSWAIVLSHAGISVTQGSRAAVLLPLFVFLTRSSIVGRGKALWHRWRAIAVLGVACTVIGPLLFTVGLTRDLGDTKMTASLVSRALTRTFGGRDLGDQMLQVMDGFYVKFEHFRTGVTLLGREGEERATWKPIKSAAFSPVPRILLPNKPVPLSRDGTAGGMPWRIAASSIGNVMSGAVVPVAPAAVALWEFGWMGVVLLVVVNVYHLIFVNTLLSCRSLVNQALGVSLLSLPTTEFLFSGPAYLLRDDLRVILYLAIISTVLGALTLYRRLAAINRRRSSYTWSRAPQ